MPVHIFALPPNSLEYVLLVDCIQNFLLSKSSVLNALYVGLGRIVFQVPASQHLFKVGHERDLSIQWYPGLPRAIKTIKPTINGEPKLDP
jgi:hypothetical protein